VAASLYRQLWAKRHLRWGFPTGNLSLNVLDLLSSGNPSPNPTIVFFTLYTMSEKIFLKLNFDFIVAEIRGVFVSVGVYACVCVCVIP